MAEVKNLNDSSGKKCKCGTWLKYWGNNSKGKIVPTFCIADGCFGTDLVGGHVKKVGATDNNQYIIPICTLHNNQDSDVEYSVLNEYFVSANKSETCDK
jgi:hypothetical protein